jgi:hypothetical protein
VRGIVAVAAVDERALRVDDAMLQRLRLLIATAERAAAATFRERYL